MNSFKEHSLEELVALYRGGDYSVDNEIIIKCSYIVKRVSRRYFLIGADTEDVYQEGLLGLLNAMRTYDESKGSFTYYAYLCVNSAVITAVRRYAGVKNEPLNKGLPLTTLDGSASFVDPEQIYIEGENRRELVSNIENELSPMERKILSLYLKGLSYSEIEEKTGKPFKSVDNALQRIRRKLRKLM
ncbi:MAG: sigma-70 family RNA polymerase sigma factor [Clostridia bacterium]|nr:sigma-70 family RNA polymerase sigma factor [Clostridia bacterium]